MNKFSIFLIITLINYNLSIKICPINCKCDLYKEKNRANCSGLNLIHPSINIPNNVEIFNLSNNSITTLDNESFQGLSNIIELILQHNSIQEIHLNAFTDLRLLTHLDLSYNRLEYFDERVLENNLNLIELNLSGNKFMLLENNPLIISKSLEVLNLKKSHLTHIYQKMFELLPSIKYLDLSENLFITIATEPFIQLLQLEHINLSKNRLKCDSNTKIALKFFHKNNITYNINDCKLQPEDLLSENNVFKGHGNMFERMMVAPSQNFQPNDYITDEEMKLTNETSGETNNWKILEKNIMEQCMASNIQIVCNHFINLMVKKNEEEKSIRIDPKDPATILYYFNNIHGEFFIGLFVGSVSISFVLVSIFICSFGMKTRTKRNLNKNDQHETYLMETVSGIEVENESPPTRTRRVRRRAPPINRSLSSPATRNASTISAQSDFATFITRLFERPTRRNRYYRTLNENTARVIRRLSQSNLFNNRLSQHFVNEVRNNSSTNQENINRTNESEINHPLITSNPTAPLADDEFSEINNDEVFLRPETPPPPYRDIVLVKK